MIAYKAFNEDLTCRNYKFKENEPNYTDKANCRENECRIVLIIIILATLGYPAAEVDAFIKAVKVSHSFPPS